MILDRGFMDGERISHCKRDLGVDVLIPMKKKMDLWKRQQERLSGRGPDQMNVVSMMLREYVVIDYQGGYEQMPVVRFARELLGLEAEARARASKKLMELENSMLAPMEKLRPE